MANPRRIQRLQQLILQTAANHVQRELEDPRIGLVSITRVKLSPDLTQAILYWSVLGDEAQQRTTERGLEHALPSIQRAIAHAMQTRVTPRCELRYDQGMENAQRMEAIFTKLAEERGEIAPIEPHPEPAEGRGEIAPLDETDEGDAPASDASDPDDEDRTAADA